MLTRAAQASRSFLAALRRGPVTLTGTSTVVTSTAAAGASKPAPSLSVWARYNELLVERPLLTKCVTSGFIACTSDVIAQILEGRRSIQEFDPLRTARFACLGSLVVAPTLHFWYGGLVRWFPGTAVQHVAIRVALDQFMFSPVFIAFVFGTLLGLEGRLSQWTTKMTTDYIPTVTSCWMFWIPVQVLSFRFAPPHLLVLCSNTAGLAWNVYLSKMANQKHP